MIFIIMKYLVFILYLTPLTLFSQYLDLDGSFDCAHEVTIYHDNGNIKEIGCYNHNKRKIGKWTSYNKQGDVVGVISFDTQGNKHGAWEIWDNQTLRARMFYTHGQRTGVWSVWNESGVLVNERMY